MSSAGLYKTVNEMYPECGLLAMFNNAGVAITPASDAHVFSDCGRDNDDVVRYARDAGYSEYIVFDKREASSVPLRTLAQT